MANSDLTCLVFWKSLLFTAQDKRSRPQKAKKETRQHNIKEIMFIHIEYSLQVTSILQWSTRDTTPTNRYKKLSTT